MPGNKELDDHHLKQNIFKQLLIAGTAACIADLATFPFDTAKGNSNSNLEHCEYVKLYFYYCLSVQYDYNYKEKMEMLYVTSQLIQQVHWTHQPAHCQQPIQSMHLKQAAVALCQRLFRFHHKNWRWKVPRRSFNIVA